MENGSSSNVSDVSSIVVSYYLDDSPEVSTYTHALIRASALSTQHKVDAIQCDLGEIQSELEVELSQYSNAFLDDWINNFGEESIRILVSEMDKRNLVDYLL